MTVARLSAAAGTAITTIEEARRSLDMTLFSGIVHGRERVAVRIGLVLRQALDEGPPARVRPVMHEVHDKAADFFRRMYHRPHG